MIFLSLQLILLISYCHQIIGNFYNLYTFYVITLCQSIPNNKVDLSLGGVSPHLKVSPWTNLNLIFSSLVVQCNC